ncbi:MAG: DNA-binding response regulator, partial [Pseudomonadales bacterium]|nr:DNA-binding response regulator [Pseudomonadales bacterium]
MVKDKITVVLVDDEPLARELLRASLADYPNLEIVAECKNGREAVEAVQQH